MIIRSVQPHDQAEWLRMRCQLWPEADPGELAAEIAQFFTPGAARPTTVQAVFVSQRSGGGLCGFVEVGIRPYAEGCRTDRVGYLEGWYVDPNSRRQGIGGALVAAAEEWARARGCSEMASDTELANSASQHAHQRLGYGEVERSVHFRKTLNGE